MDAFTFERVHRAQLEAIGFPPGLISRLFTKFTSKHPENLEKTFELSPSSKDHKSTSGRILKCRRSLGALSDVFILQHIWESDGGSGARKALLNDHNLLVRIENLLGIVQRRERGDGKKEREEMMEVICQQTNKSKSIARKALAESGYDLIAAIFLAQKMTEGDDDISKNKDEKPSLTMEEFRRGFDGLCSGRAQDKLSDSDIEAMYKDWKIKKQRETNTEPDNWVLCEGYKWKLEEDGIITVIIPLPPNTQKKDIVSDITSRRWKFGFRGIKQSVIDGEFCGRIVPDDCYWTIDGDSVSVSVQRSVECERWRELIAGEVQREEKDDEREIMLRVDNIMERMWRVNQTYTAVTQEGEQCPVWYMMQSYGLALTHNCQPIFACHPFSNALTGSMVSLIWPVMDVCVGDICTRDYIPSLYPGETESARKMRETIILENRPLQQQNNVPSILPPLPTLPHNPASTFHLSPSSPIKLYISSGDRNPTVWAWECPEIIICSSVQNADVILGHHELLSPTLLKDATHVIARIHGDQVLTHKTKFIQFTRGNSNCIQGINLRSEIDIHTLVAMQEQQSLRREVVDSWYVVLPDGPWSAVPHHITNNSLEIIRLSEIGPAIATHFQQCSVLHDGQCCCLQYSVVIVSSEGGGKLEAYLHTRPRVRLAAKSESEARFRQWNTEILLSSSVGDVQWDVFLSLLMETYKVAWSLLPITRMVSELISSAVLESGDTGGALYTVDILLLYKLQQLVPLIIGVDPIPSFSDSQVARECLDLMLRHARQTDNFVSL